MIIETEYGLCDERGLIMLNEPRPCPVCKAAHRFFVNRGGRTICAACAPESREAA